MPGSAEVSDFAAEVDFEGFDSAEADFVDAHSAEELVGFDFAEVGSEDPGLAGELGLEAPDFAEAGSEESDLVEEPGFDRWDYMGFAWARRA